MQELDGRLIVLLVWGGGTVITYGRVLALRANSYMVHRDTRAKRDLIEAFGLFLTALCSGASIFLVLFGPVGTGIRGFAVAIALGAFLAVGIVMATEKSQHDE